MTSLLFADPLLIIALNNKLISVYTNDLQIFWEVKLPEDLTKVGLKPYVATEDNQDESIDGKKKQQTEFPSIQHVAFSPDQQLLAITTAGQKAVLLYQIIKMVHAKLVSVRPLARTSSALTFDSNSKTLLVTDKTGDCYQYDCVDLEAAPRLLFGHLSVVYDVIWGANDNFIITCDRDDKIRITNYPQSYDILGYCLGHKEFVSGLALLDEQTLLSVSGDKTLRLWKYETGEQLEVVELPAPGIRFAMHSVDANKVQIAVLLHQPNECVALYELSKNTAATWVVKEQSVLSFPGVIVSNLCYAKERLFVAGIVDEHFTLRVAENTPAPPKNWIKMVNEQFEDQPWKSEDVSSWFKKRYDNVSDYLERKKRRMEEKQK